MSREIDIDTFLRTEGFTEPDDDVRTSEEAWQNLKRGLMDAVTASIRARSRRSITQFAEDEITLQAKDGEGLPGKYDQSKNPVTREPQEAFADPEVRTIVLAACAQGGKSRTLANVVGWKIKEDPENMIIGYPAASTAREKAKRDFHPLFNDTPCLKELVHQAAVDRLEKSTMLNWRYPGGGAKLVSTASATQTASTPAGFVLLDEYSRVTDTAEGDPFTALQVRMVRFPFYKIAVASTLIGRGCRTAKAYAKSDKSVPFVTCPHCQHEHAMKWEFVHIPKETVSVIDESTGEETFEERGEMIPARATYRCPHCATDMSDGARYAMLDGVQWKQTATFHCCNHRHDPVKTGKWDDKGIALCPTCGRRAPKHARGFLWSILYVKVPLDRVASDWKDAQGDPVKLRQFFNDQMAMEWDIDPKGGSSADELRGRREDYQTLYGPGVEVPEPVIGLFASIDVNPSYGLDMEVVGFGPGEESFGVKYLVALGDVRQVDPWRQCEELRLKLWRGVDGRLYRIILTAVDVNDANSHADAMRYVTPRIGKGVVPIKGRKDGPIWSPTVSLVGRHTEPHYPIGTMAGKTVISGRLRILDDGPGKMHWPADVADMDGNIIESTGYTEEYFDQLANLRKQLRRNAKTGGMVEDFVGEIKNMRQEAWDLNVYNLALMRGWVLSRGFRSIDDIAPQWKPEHEVEAMMRRSLSGSSSRPPTVQREPTSTARRAPATGSGGNPFARGDRI